MHTHACRRRSDIAFSLYLLAEVLVSISIGGMDRPPSNAPGIIDPRKRDTCILSNSHGGDQGSASGAGTETK